MAETGGFPESIPSLNSRPAAMHVAHGTCLSYLTGPRPVTPPWLVARQAAAGAGSRAAGGRQAPMGGCSGRAGHVMVVRAHGRA